MGINLSALHKRVGEIDPLVVKRLSFSEQEPKKLVKKRLEEQVESPQKQFPVAEKVKKDFSFLRTFENCQVSTVTFMSAVNYQKARQFYQSKKRLKMVSFFGLHKTM